MNPKKEEAVSGDGSSSVVIPIVSVQPEHKPAGESAVRTPEAIPSQWLDTAQQGMERELRRYQDLFDLAPVGYLITNQQGIIQKVNILAWKLLESAPESLEGSFLS